MSDAAASYVACRPRIRTATTFMAAPSRELARARARVKRNGRVDLDREELLLCIASRTHVLY